MSKWKRYSFLRMLAPRWYVTPWSSGRMLSFDIECICKEGITYPIFLIIGYQSFIPLRKARQSPILADRRKMTQLAEENQSVIDLGDVDGYVSASDFSDYMAANLEMSEKTSKNFTVFWNENHDGSNNPQALLSSPSQSGSLVKEKIKTALQGLGFSKSEYILVQFWALATIEDCQILTTTDQPFGVTRLRNEPCRYKKICARNNYGTEGETAGDFLMGPPSRAVQNGFPEYSPNIQFYSSTEFILRDDAERCKISYYLGLPVFEKSSEFCGVLELVASSGSDVMMALF